MPWNKNLRCFPAVALAVFGMLPLFVAGCHRMSPEAEIHAGEQALRQRKNATAVIDFRRALQQRPRSVRAAYGLARAEMAVQDWPAAYNALRRCLMLRAGDIPARLDLARLYFFHHQYRHALREAGQVIRLQANNAAAWQVKAAAEGGAGRLRRSAADFRHVAQLRPRDPNSWINLALMEVRLRQLNRAARHLRHAQSLNPALPLPYLDLAGLARIQGRLAAVPRFLNQGIAQAPKSAALYMALARYQLETNGRPAAEAVVQRLRRLRPHDPAIALSVGDFCYQAGFFRQARRAYQRGFETHDLNMRLAFQHRLLRLALHLHQWNAARARMLVVLHAHPQDFQAQLAQARLWLVDHQISKAFSRLHELAADNPESARANYYLGLAEWAQGDRATALRQLQIAHQLAPRAPNVVRGLARMNLAQGQLDSARRYARLYQTLAPQAPGVNTLLGTVALAQGDWAQARAALARAQAAHPQDIQSQLLLARADLGARQTAAAGRIYVQLLHAHAHSSRIAGAAIHFYAQFHQWAKARQVAQNFILANPKNAQGHWLLASLAMQRRHLNRAAAELHRALQLDPRLLPAVLDLSRLRQRQQNLPRAIVWLQRASQLQPNFPPLLTLLGNLYLSQKRYRLARQYYHHALRVDPQFALAQANLAWVYAQQKRNLPQALILAQQAEKQMPNLPSVLDTLSWVYFRLHSYGAAIPLLRRCVADAPRNPMFHYHLGRALLASGEKRAGLRQIELALQLKLPPDQTSRARSFLVAQN